MAKPQASPENKRERHSFIEESREMGGTVINTKSPLEESGD